MVLIQNIHPVLSNFIREKKKKSHLHRNPQQIKLGRKEEAKHKKAPKLSPNIRGTSSGC